MPRKKILLVLFIVSSIIIGTLVIYFSQATSNQSQSSSESSKESTQKSPKVEINITNYTEKVNSPCQDYTLELDIKNTGDAVLEYKDITDETYEFGVTADARVLNNNPEYIKIEDFGEIKPGESKQVTLYIGYIEEPTPDTENFNNRFKDITDENKTMNITVRLYRDRGKSNFHLLGESQHVQTEVAIYKETENGKLSLKKCK